MQLRYHHDGKYNVMSTAQLEIYGGAHSDPVDWDADEPN